MDVEQIVEPGGLTKQLIAFITEKVLKGKSVQIDEDTPLVSSGLIDSFALIEIFLELEKVTKLKVPASKVQAKDMDTVRSMFALAEKFGKPSKK
jgi:D-alanine--poly(phosphoribitol) ligase subunit 2